MTDEKPRLTDAETQTDVQNDLEIAQIRQDMVRLRKTVTWHTQLLWLLLAFLVATVIKNNVSAPKGDVDWAELTGAKEQPPFYMLCCTSFLGTVAAVLALGPPRLTDSEPQATHTLYTESADLLLDSATVEAGQSGEPEEASQSEGLRQVGWKDNLKTLYQCVLMLLFVYNVVIDGERLWHFSTQQWAEQESFVAFVWRALLGACAILATGGNTDDLARNIALCQLTVSHMKFVRAHDMKFFHNPEEVYPGDQQMRNHLDHINGRIFFVYIRCCWVFTPLGLITLIGLAIPVTLAYFWFFIPVFVSLGVVIAVTVVPPILWLYPKKEAHCVTMYEAHMSPLNANDVCHVSFVLHQESLFIRPSIFKLARCRFTTSDFDRYQDALSAFFASGLTRSQWCLYISLSVLLQVMATLIITVGLRLFTGNGYIESLTTTLAERHWYTYGGNMVSSFTSILSLPSLIA